MTNENTPTGAASVLMDGLALRSMTDDNAAAWANMGISKEWQIKRLTDWANMLEKRLAEFDRNYRCYPFGRRDVGMFRPEDHVNTPVAIEQSGVTYEG